MQDSPLKDLLKKGIQKSLEEQQVPLHLHLKVVDALSKSMIAHKADLNLMHVMANRHAKQLNQHDEMTKAERDAHNQQLSQYDQEIQRLTSIQHLQGETGQDGSDGKDGETHALEVIVEALRPYIPTPLQGEKGKDAQFDKEAFKKEMVDFLRETKPLDISHIKNAQTFIKDGVKYKIEELMRGAGGGTSGGLTIIPVTGTVDDSNMTFAATSQPTLLNINGAFYQNSGGAITWSYATGVITLSSPVGAGGQIYGLK